MPHKESHTAASWFSRGIAALESGAHVEAEDCFRRTRDLSPESLEAILNLGYALDLQHRFAEAFQCYNEVLAVAPNHAKARYNRARHLLRTGDLAGGFVDYEARFAAINQIDQRHYQQPRWDGSPLDGHSILVYCEQGLGDALMFARYLPQVAVLGGKIILEAQFPLMRLLSWQRDVTEVVAKSTVPPSTDVRIPLLSLPYLFHTTLESIPNHVPYLTVAADILATWKSRFHVSDGTLRIGLAWAGKAHPYPYRSCPPEFLLPLLNIPGISWYSLQIGELDRWPQPPSMAEQLIDLTPNIQDFADTAALISHLDLVITIDTAVAHLSGALGKPTYLLVTHHADWRWLLDRSDSPWYPSMRLFRQAAPDDWESAIDGVAQALRGLISAPIASSPHPAKDREDTFSRALTALDENRLDEAIALLRPMVTDHPDEPALWFNLGRAYGHLEQFTEARNCYLQTLRLQPDKARIWQDAGNISVKRKSFREAETYLRKAHELMPESVDILLDLGAVFVQLDKTSEAFECCRKILEIEPDNQLAIYNRAYLSLRSGDYAAGFADFESRLQIPQFNIEQRSYPQPRWDGTALNGKTLLVIGEQGMGDVIQFSRYIPFIIERGGKVVLEVDPPLIPLFQDFSGITLVVPKSVTPPRTDYYIHLLSLPHIFGTQLATVPNQIPYLQPDPVKLQAWRQLMEGYTSLRVGLVWRGNPRNPVDRERSAPLSCFAPLTAMQGITLFSLQVGGRPDELASLPPEAPLVDHTIRLADFSDTAAFIANLDLVIGVDTSVIHLAGALGKPVWVLLSHVYEWRWLKGRTDSPWYPTARLFWQERSGDWDGVIARVAAALTTWRDALGSVDDGLTIEECYRLGSERNDNGDLAEAEHCFRWIVTRAPELPDPQHSLGVVLHAQGRYQEAIEHYRQAVASDPAFAQAHYNLANALLQAGNYIAAREAAEAAIHSNSQYADAHWLLGMLQLLQGDFLNGWREYEWRWQAKAFKATLPEIACPCWDGTPLHGKRILLRMEQGRGDMIQFIRYAPLLAAMGGHVIVCATPDLLSLLATTQDVEAVVDQGEDMPPCDVQVPVLSLPRLFETTLKTVPAIVPYLLPDRDKVAAWRQLMPTDGSYRIGIAWQGNPGHRDDRNRSCSLMDLSAIFHLPNVSFFSLQIGPGAEQLHGLPDDFTIRDFTGNIHDFSDTAALIENLDLVICVDTATAHLAGALGKPVWTLLPFVPDWRWLLEREDSPWYPSMRLFRQEIPGNWQAVVARMRNVLAKLVSSPGNLKRQGIVQMNAGLFAEAEKSFAAEVARNPNDAEALCNWGVALAELQHHEEAIARYRSALAIRPDFFNALYNMGNACLALGNRDGAQACYGRVLELAPDFIPAHICLGEIAKARADYPTAHACFRQALHLDPSCIEALQGIGETLQAEEQFTEAITAYREVLSREPARAATWNMLGTVYHSLELLEDAESCYRQALVLLPDRQIIQNNLGVVLNDQGRHAEAIATYRRLLAQDPEYAEGHWNLAVALLATEQYLEGWREYEWRFRKPNPVPERGLSVPLWDGAPLKGKTIMLHAEQAFGDTIQFARYVPLVARLGGKVILECQVPALKRLLTSLEGNPTVIVRGEQLPPHDCHLPLMSLPVVFGTAIDTIPDRIPYLVPDPDDLETWKSRLEKFTGFRVGLVWFAKQTQILNRKRSCPLDMLAALWQVPEVQFFSLQIGPGSEQLAALNPDIPIHDLTPQILDFADTAAIMANLDLVITIDTVTAHLAGALGVRTWVLLPHVAEWRWHCQRTDSPWYPSMQLFRQPQRGDWAALSMQVAAELSSLLASSRTT